MLYLSCNQKGDEIKDLAELRYQIQGGNPKWLKFSITKADKEKFFPQGFICDVAELALLDKRSKKGRAQTKSWGDLEEYYKSQAVAYLLQSQQIEKTEDVVFLNTDIMPTN